MRPKQLFFWKIKFFRTETYLLGHKKQANKTKPKAVATTTQQLRQYLHRADANTYEASLMLARYSDPGLDVERYMHLLHAWSVELGDAITCQEKVQTKIAKLNEFLFQEKGFHVDHDDFYNPANSMMHLVIERRTGIPVTMSALYTTLGQKVGIDLQGISFPGHFLVKAPVDEGIFVLDPYHRGASLSEDQLTQLLQHADPKATEDSMIKYLESATIEETVMRMMRSLKTVYFRQGNHEQTLDILNMMLEMNPELVDERRERGLMLRELQCQNSALMDLEHYVKHRPNCSEATQLRIIIKDLRAGKALLH